ncbi:hypothetical protein [Paraburkholderia fungorum]|uniref:hypothetical protein n=1 Tax=Paraburkholderia fungorum TaxID=134537 RepID=UPI0038BE1565
MLTALQLLVRATIPKLRFGTGDLTQRQGIPVSSRRTGIVDEIRDAMVASTEPGTREGGSTRHLQRFTSIHDQVANLFTHCRHNANAQKTRQARSRPSSPEKP